MIPFRSYRGIWLTHYVGGRRRSSYGQDQIHQLEEIETGSHYDEEGVTDRGMGALHHIRSRTRSRTNEVVFRWAPNDPENPYNWTSVRFPLFNEQQDSHS